MTEDKLRRYTMYLSGTT